MVKRHAIKTLKDLSKMFSSVIITGSRQVGKTTLLQEYGKSFEYLSFDDPILVNEFNENGKNFLENYNLPLILDEVQYVPKIFNYIKILCDKLKKKGIIFMSGSQQFKMMENVSESLTGRVGILNISTLSNREINNEEFYNEFIPSDKYFNSRKKTISNFKEKEIWHNIQRGLLPELYVNKKFDSKKYYAAYLSTYIERDVRTLTQVSDEITFSKFMVSLAARTGQLLNKAEIAREVSTSETTIDRWLSILKNSNIIYLLYPYANNRLKRVIKTPKVYFLDTGLCAFLTKWTTSDTLSHGAMAGHFFETFVISEIVKSFYNNGIIDPPLYYYRDKDMVEVDLIIESNGIIHPIEIKKYTNYNKNDMSSFRVFNKLNDIKVGNGGIICMYDKLLKLDEKKYIIPINYI